MLFYIAMEDYTRQNTEMIFPPGSQIGDKQCLGVPIIDNDTPDGFRAFIISIASFHPFVRVVRNYGRTLVPITDNEGM